MGPKRQKMSAEDAVANILQFVEGGDELEDEIDYEDEEKLSKIYLEMEGLFYSCVFRLNVSIVLHIVFI